MKAVHGSTKWCHICGFRITPDIVSSDHPLYGTVDHVIPVAHGGANTVDNRRAAHRYCNARKGCRKVALSQEFVSQLQGEIRAFLRKALMGEHAAPMKLKEARDRIKFDSLVDLEVTAWLSASKRRNSDDISVWESEGGSYI